MKIHLTVVLVILLLLSTGCFSMKEDSSVSSPPEDIPSTVEEKASLDLSGYWEGSLAISPTATLVMGFTITSSDNGRLEVLLQIPSQGVRDMSGSSIRLEETLLTIEMEAVQASFSGTYDAETKQIVGTFVQMGHSLPLVLSLSEQKEQYRPQVPQKPYPYISEDIVFTQSTEGFLLAGTITRPVGEGPFPSVVLVSGSGSQNRDEELVGHRPFLVLSDALTRSGIVVLRYDDRGFAKSGGDASSATTLDFASDTESAVTYLKTLSYVDAERIGIIGHSEGALIGPIVAQRSKDVDFLVLMAGTGVDGVAVLEDQTAAILRAQGASEEIVEQTVSSNLAIYATVLDESQTLEERKESVLQTLLSLGLPPESAKAQARSLFSPWYMTFLTLDPATYLQYLDIPVMILNGTKDTQVSASLNIPAIEASLLSGGNTLYTTKVYEGLNHLFQPAITGSPEEYGSIETTIDPQVLDDIASWIAGVKARP